MHSIRIFIAPTASSEMQYISLQKQCYVSRLRTNKKKKILLSLHNGVEIEVNKRKKSPIKTYYETKEGEVNVRYRSK